jgi:L-serine dehydratase
MEKKELRYHSAFEIIGPIMVGPSSSHTAGAVRIGKVARDIFGQQPTKLVVTFYGSFAKTYRGHGTALAIVAGVLGYATNDERIPDSLSYAKKAGIQIEFLASKKQMPDANTAQLVLSGSKGQLSLIGVSVGGGNIQITNINGKAIQGSGIILRVQKNIIATAFHQYAASVVYETENEQLLLIESNQGFTTQERNNFLHLPGVLAIISTNT